MSETSAQAFNVKAYVNNLLGEKRELEAAKITLEAEKEKLKQGVLKYGELAKTMEEQNKGQQTQLQELRQQLERTREDNARLRQEAAQWQGAPRAPAPVPAPAVTALPYRPVPPPVHVLAPAVQAPPPASNYSVEVADILMAAQRTAKQIVADAEQRARAITQDAYQALSNICLPVTQIRDVLRGAAADIAQAEARLSSLQFAEK
jgi:cell division septum initiation protein DivIVA